MYMYKYFNSNYWYNIILIKQLDRYNLQGDFSPIWKFVVCIFSENSFVFT